MRNPAGNRPKGGIRRSTPPMGTSPKVNQKTAMGKPAGLKCVSRLSGGVRPFGAGKRGGRRTA